MLRHYSDRRVLEEISYFARGRWLALESKPVKGRRHFIRWLPGRVPLKAGDPLELRGLLHRLRGHRPRTVYASITVYKRLASPRDLEDPENIVAATPFWDVDASLEEWKKALEAARLIACYLEDWGVRRSLYLVWSGEGVHVRIHEKAFREALEKAHPVDIAFAVVEYVLRKLKDRLQGLMVRSSVLKVENLVDYKRVFTAPLSLHRERDIVAVPFKLDDIDEFNPLEWGKPGDYRYNPAWRDYVEGEADTLALEALKHIPPSRSPLAPLKLRATRIEVKPAEAPELPVEGRVGRFQVMALLQAARYYLLYGDLEKAKSFGLNRAIFYAWAKHYGPHKRTPWRQVGKTTRTTGTTDDKRFVEVAGEKVQLGPDGYFMMGGVEQTPRDFDRQVTARFEAAGVSWEKAWEAALRYLSRFPKTVLKDPQKFYSMVYEPVRDNFLERVLGGAGEEKQKSLEAFLRKPAKK